MKKIHTKILFSLMLIIANIIMLGYIFNTNEEINATSPFFLPTIIAYVTSVLNLLILCENLREYFNKTKSNMDENSKQQNIKFDITSLYMIIIILGYILLMFITNFRISTILFLCLSMVYLKPNLNIKQIFIMSFTITYWLVFIFEYIFKTMLP